jgi:hypothetical protein
VPITIHVGALPPGDANDLLVRHAGLDEQARGAHARRFRSGHEHAQLSLGKVTLTLQERLHGLRCDVPLPDDRQRTHDVHDEQLAAERPRQLYRPLECRP